MNIDTYGRVILNESEVFSNLYSGLLENLDKIFLEEISETDKFNRHIDENADTIPKIPVITNDDISIEQFDNKMQNNWFFTEKYKSFDIGKWLIDQCSTEIEKTRVLEELELFIQYDMIELLNYLKYLVDLMREKNIVWGLGRGSSVASYCLYLIGIHKIDSIKYDLDIREFLK